MHPKLMTALACCRPAQLNALATSAAVLSSQLAPKATAFMKDPDNDPLNFTKSLAQTLANNTAFAAQVSILTSAHLREPGRAVDMGMG